MPYSSLPSQTLLLQVCPLTVQSPSTLHSVNKKRILFYFIPQKVCVRDLKGQKIVSFVVPRILILSLFLSIFPSVPFLFLPFLFLLSYFINFIFIPGNDFPQKGLHHLQNGTVLRNFQQGRL
jgi:hypothetical protein